MSFFKICSWLVVCLFSFHCIKPVYAFQAQSAPVYIDTPNNMEVNGQYYDVSVGGIGDYMESIEKTNPALYSKMLPEYENLKTKRNIAYLTSGALGAAGLILFLGSFSFLQKDDSSFPGGKTLNSTTALGGVGLFATSLIVYSIISPGRSDFMRFINQHNQSNPNAPLKWQLGVAPTLNGEGVSGLLAVRF